MDESKYPRSFEEVENNFKRFAEYLLTLGFTEDEANRALNVFVFNAVDGLAKFGIRKVPIPKRLHRESLEDSAAFIYKMVCIFHPYKLEFVD